MLPGVYAYSYSTTDGSGNVAVCNFSLHIVDRAPPVVHHCPDGVSVTLDEDAVDATVSWRLPTAVDIVDGPLLPWNTSAVQPGVRLVAGTTPVAYQFRDAAGNAAACAFDIVVQPGTFFSKQVRFETTESAPPGHVLGVLGPVRTQDQANKFIFTIRGLAGRKVPPFRVDELMQLRTTDELDREATAFYNLTVVKVKVDSTGGEVAASQSQNLT